MNARTEQIADVIANSLSVPDWPHPIWIVARREGRRLGSAWVEPGPLWPQLTETLPTIGVDKATHLELAVFRYPRTVDPATTKSFAKQTFGRVGYIFRLGDEETRIAPTEIIARNRAPQRMRDTFLSQHDLDPGGFRNRGATLMYETSQAFLALGPEGATHAAHMFRGNEVFPVERIDAAEAQAMLDRMTGWAMVNQSPDGSLPYKYWPSRGETSSADNVIRQFLATLGLLRAAKLPGRAYLQPTARANLYRNLSKYVTDCGDYSALVCNGKAKLGAAALAGLAILEHEGDKGPLAETLNKIRLGIDRLWQPDGAFRTFLWPEDRNDSQNFYPGEALLFYARLYLQTREPAILERCRLSFATYRAWHRKQPNPAFIPWHTQAYVHLYEATGDDEFRDFVFEMSDMIAKTQQWGNPLPPDLWGRFFDPNWRGYGPPHASSTGVYMEGLAAAYRLARDTGDSERAATYRLCLRRGLRNLRQLQIASDIDAFYMARRRAVIGALRIEVYNNEIRLDNLGHALLALTNLPSWDTVEAA